MVGTLYIYTSEVKKYSVGYNELVSVEVVINTEDKK